MQHVTSSSPTADSRPWLVLIYRTTTPCSQQSILRRLAAAATSPVTAIGTSSGPDDFVVAECASEQEAAAIEQIVRRLDPHAELIYASTPPGPLVSWVRGDDVL